MELVPNNYRPGDRLVVFCHAHEVGATWWYRAGDAWGCRSMVDGSGLIAVSADLGVNLNNWGAPDADDAIDAAWARMVSRYGVASDKVMLVGISMGGLTALNYAVNNPTKVSAVLALVPAVSLQHHHDDPVTLGGSVPDDDGTGWDHEIDVAYGGHSAYLEALSTRSPYHHMTFPDIPLLCYVSDNDTQAPPDLVEEYVTAVGGRVRSLGAVAHTFGDGSRGLEAGRWLRANG
jgi:predicted alpha/beta hydrolase family esterase